MQGCSWQQPAYPQLQQWTIVECYVPESELEARDAEIRRLRAEAAAKDAEAAAKDAEIERLRAEAATKDAEIMRLDDAMFSHALEQSLKSPMDQLECIVDAAAAGMDEPDEGVAMAAMLELRGGSHHDGAGKRRPTKLERLQESTPTSLPDRRPTKRPAALDAYLADAHTRRIRKTGIGIRVDSEASKAPKAPKAPEASQASQAPKASKAPKASDASMASKASKASKASDASKATRSITLDKKVTLMARGLMSGESKNA